MSPNVKYILMVDWSFIFNFKTFSTEVLLTYNIIVLVSGVQHSIHYIHHKMLTTMNVVTICPHSVITILLTIFILYAELFSKGRFLTTMNSNHLSSFEKIFFLAVGPLHI